MSSDTEDTNEHLVSESEITAAKKSNESDESPRLTKLKAAFLYVLIGALVASAVTAVLALLLGDQFQASIGKSLLTIFILFGHSLFVLALLWADRYNDVGRKLLPTSILVLTFANMITTMLGTWDLMADSTAWRAFWYYFFILGAVFIIIGTLRLRVNRTAPLVALYTAVGLIGLSVLSLTPWVLDWFAPLNEMYYRIIAALSIVTATVYMIAIILRGITLGRDPLLKSAPKTPAKVSGGMLSIYITLGTITAIVYISGLGGLIFSGIQASTPDCARNYPYSCNGSYRY